MKLGKMSLVAAIMVAGLSNVAFAADTKISGELDAELKYMTKSKTFTNSEDDMDGSLTFLTKSDDGTGSFRAKLGLENGGKAVGLSALEASFKVGPVTVTGGPLSGVPGAYTDNPSSDVIKAKINAGGFDVEVGRAWSKETTVVATSGNVGPAKINADLVMPVEGDLAYAAVASTDVAGASITAGYAGSGQENIMGASAGYSVAEIKLSASVAIGYAKGEDNYANLKDLIADPSNEIGDLGYGKTAFKVAASKAILGVTVGASFKSVDNTKTYDVTCTRKHNSQTKHVATFEGGHDAGYISYQIVSSF